jgi:hypothetical protein
MSQTELETRRGRALELLERSIEIVDVSTRPRREEPRACAQRVVVLDPASLRFVHGADFTTPEGVRTSVLRHRPRRP